MAPGVTAMVESASLARVFDAFAAHRIHALVVLRARDAITERVIGIRPSAGGEGALTRLLREGVVSELDLVVNTPR